MHLLYLGRIFRVYPGVLKDVDGAKKLHISTIFNMYVCMYVYSLASISGESHIEHIN